MCLESDFSTICPLYLQKTYRKKKKRLQETAAARPNGTPRDLCSTCSTNKWQTFANLHYFHCKLLCCHLIGCEILFRLHKTQIFDVYDSVIFCITRRWATCCGQVQSGPVNPTGSLLLCAGVLPDTINSLKKHRGVYDAYIP